MNRKVDTSKGFTPMTPGNVEWFEKDDREFLLKAALQTMDAAVWAKAFVAHTKRNPAIATDEATMQGWFANAIMCGYDRKKPKKVRAN